jgi:hypothetical protein
MPRVAPATDGAITLYWHNQLHGKHLTVAVYGEGRLEARSKRTGEIATSVPTSLDDVVARLLSVIA